MSKMDNWVHKSSTSQLVKSLKIKWTCFSSQNDEYNYHLQICIVSISLVLGQFSPERWKSNFYPLVKVLNTAIDEQFNFYWSDGRMLGNHYSIFRDEIGKVWNKYKFVKHVSIIEYLNILSPTQAEA